MPAVRRTLILAAVVALGALLLTIVHAPTRPRGKEGVRGHRVFGVAAGAVQGIEVELGGRRFHARRAPSGWELDGREANPRAAEALSDLLQSLVELRAVDVFRPRDGATYGLDRPHATVGLITARGVRRLVIGTLNAAGSAVYARREGAPRVVQIGTLLLSELERVFYVRDGR
jgi:hypothetical protein